MTPRLQPVRFCPRCGGPVKIVRIASVWTAKRKVCQYENHIVCKAHPGIYWIEFEEPRQK